MSTIFTSKTDEGYLIGYPPEFVPGLERAGWARLWNFDISKSAHRPGHFPVMKKAAEYLKANPGHYCRIVGLASRSGRNDFNMRVSDLRARNTHGYFAVIEGIGDGQLMHRSGSRFLSLGEEAYRVIHEADKRRFQDGKENAYHRSVVLMFWTHNHPTAADEAYFLNRILRGDTSSL